MSRKSSHIRRRSTATSPPAQRQPAYQRVCICVCVCLSVCICVSVLCVCVCVSMCAVVFICCVVVSMSTREVHVLRAASMSQSQQEARYFAVHLFAQTKHSQKAGPFPVARLETDLPFHKRLAYAGEVPALLSQLRTMRSEEAVPN